MDTQSNSSHNPAEGNGKLLSIPDYLIQPSLRDEEEDIGSQHLFGLLRRRALVIAGVAVVAISIVSVMVGKQTPQFKGEFQLLVEPITAQSLDQVTQEGNQTTQNNGLDYPTQIQVLLSPKTLEPIVKQIQAQYPEIDYDTLMGGLSIEQPKDTKIISVSYVDLQGDRGGDILTKLSQGYLRYSQQERQSNLREGIKFVDGRISQTQRRVDNLQRDLQNFREKNNFVDPETQVGQVSGQLNGLQQQRLETEKLLAETQRSFENLQGGSGAVAALAADPAYQSVVGQLREIDSKIAIETARFQDDTPEIDALRTQRRNLLPVLRQEARRVLTNKIADINTQLSVLQARQQSNTNAQRALDQQGKRLPMVARLYTDLQRDLTVATDSLKRLLEVRESLQIQASQRDVPWQLIVPPKLPLSREDTRARTLFIGVLASLLLGVAIALIVERMDTTINTIDDLKKQAKLPLLGNIPYNAELRTAKIATIIPQLLQLNSLGKIFNGQSQSRSYTHQVFPEAFRSLHTNIRLIRSEAPILSLVIGSAMPGNGKSTIATHLAQAAAAMGQRVLLVDADLRNPQLNNLLDLPEAIGLSDLIATDLHPEQVIRPVYQVSPALVGGGETLPEPTAEQNLYVVTSGQIPVDPTKLLASQKMQQLVNYFETVFDLVIYDTPPLLSLADSSLLATHTDGMILVVDLGQTDRPEIAQTLDTLKTARIPILGMVANHSK
ncbi:GumC family protein [Phormidesmis sp. 146-12]